MAYNQQPEPPKVSRGKPLDREGTLEYDSADAAKSLGEAFKDFMMPAGASQKNDSATGARDKPVNTNPFHSAGEPSAEQFGMGRGKDGAI